MTGHPGAGDGSAAMSLLRLIAGPLILVGVLVWVDVPEVLARLQELRPRWIALALAIAGLQMAGSAWRWRFTAARLGVELPIGAAVREYWLAGFLNQVTPGGVMGDLTRAIRHAREPGGVPGHGSGRVLPGRASGLERRAVHAVILERLSGQIVVVVAGVVSGAVLLTPLPGAWAVAGGLAGLVVGVAVARPPDPSGGGGADGPMRFRDALRRAVLDRDALLVQLLTSTALVASYVAVYLAAARAVGVDTPMATLLPLVTPVLLAMLIPVSVAGWGVREGAAAALWAAVGLPAAEGVAISVAYGSLVLASVLPGAVVLALEGVSGRGRTRRAGRGRRGGRFRGGGAEPVADGPRRARPPAGD